jgi:hypothetical protein
MEAKEEEFKKLTSQLKSKIKVIIKDQKPNELKINDEPSRDIERAEIIIKQHGNNTFVGNPIKSFSTKRDSAKVQANGKSFFYLFIGPSYSSKGISNNLALDLVGSPLIPLSSSYRQGNFGRNQFGIFHYAFPNDELYKANSYSMIMKFGSILGVNFSTLINETIPVHYLEQTLVSSLNQYLDIIKNKFSIDPPLTLMVGLKNVENFSLALGSHETDGEIITPSVDYKSHLTSYPANPYEVLEPFFEKYFDEACVQRPKEKPRYL